MKISVISDLYLYNSHETFIKNDTEIMILAGNIGTIENTQCVLNFINFHIKNGVKHILYILGNHEFYDKRNEIYYTNNKYTYLTNQYYINKDSYNNTLKKWLEIEKKIKELHILHKKEFVYKNIRFLGTTLWTNFDKKIENTEIAFNTLVDYRYITYNNNYLTPHDVFNFHIKEKKWLEKKLSDKNKNIIKTVVISNHVPTYSCIPYVYYKNYNNFLYTSNLDSLIKKHKIDYWFHGHVHMSVNMIHLNTHFICNPKGFFEKENPFFNYNFIIDI